MTKPLHVALDEILLQEGLIGPSGLRKVSGDRLDKFVALAESVANSYGARVSRAGVSPSGYGVAVIDIKPLHPPQLSFANVAAAAAAEIKQISGNVVRMHRDGGFSVYSGTPQGWIGGLTPDGQLRLTIGGSKSNQFAEAIGALLGLKQTQCKSNQEYKYA